MKYDFINKKIIFILLSIVIFIVAFVLAFQYLINSRFVKISFTDVKEVKIYDYDGHSHADNNEKPIAVVDKTDTSVRLEKDKVYEAIYTAVSDDFSNGILYISTDDKSISIAPEFSSKKNSQLLEKERPKILDLLNSKYNGIEQYNLDNESLTRDQKWYIVTLVYKGDKQDENSDTLKIILKKSNDQWEITCKPSIVLTTYNCPHAPSALVQKINTIDL